MDINEILLTGIVGALVDHGLEVIKNILNPEGDTGKPKKRKSNKKK